jgi:hypothetical protein
MVERCGLPISDKVDLVISLFSVSSNRHDRLRPSNLKIASEFRERPVLPVVEKERDPMVVSCRSEELSEVF